MPPSSSNMNPFLPDQRQGDPKKDINGLDCSPLYKFYQTTESPWVPSGIFAQNPTNAIVSANYSAPVYDFSDYRSRGEPSDCATLPEDSGYGGSRPTCSIESTSVHGDDRGVSGQLLEKMMDSCAVDMHGVSSGPHRHFCTTCKETVKTRSELNKHHSRHMKPHLCDYTNCSRSQRGFSTANDLIRHKRTVHNEYQRDGRTYVCLHCSGQNKTQKRWPRADNFRSHLARVHQKHIGADEGLNEYIYRPSADESEVGTLVSHMDAKGLASPRVAYTPADVNFPEAFGSPGQIDLSPSFLHGLPSVDEANYIRPDVLSNLRAYSPIPRPTLDQGINQISPNDGEALTQFVRPEGLSMLENAPRQIETSQKTEVPLNNLGSLSTLGLQSSSSASCGSSDAGSDDGSLDHEYSRLEFSDNQGIPSHGLEGIPLSQHISDMKTLQHLLKSLPKELVDQALNEGVTEPEQTILLQDESSSRSVHLCPQCSKSFNRACELKKHIKRHEKPYGCTFPQCSKLFGSKNDWKRHESSQHFQLESWNCDEKDCKKICYRRESFKHHLQKDHRMEDASKLDEKLESCRLGRHCDSRFWCGFCVKVIEITTPGVNSWTRRCDHIDHHLFGKDGLALKRINEWKYLEDQEGQTSPGNSKRLQVQMVMESTLASPSDVKGSSRGKRPSSVELESPPPKRQEIENTYMWGCCNCASMINFKTSSRCFECHHVRCSAGCLVERALDHKDEQCFDTGDV